jgi:lysine biosynthesis protein LysW
MKCTCPECKNDIDMSKFPKAAVGHVIECPTCGIVLEVRSIDNNVVTTEIVDEGK